MEDVINAVQKAIICAIFSHIRDYYKFGLVAILRAKICLKLFDLGISTDAASNAVARFERFVD